MKKFLLVLFMLFIPQNCFAYTIREAWDIYYDSAWGKRIITIYTNGFVKGYIKGYTWRMIKAENIDNKYTAEYDECLRKSVKTNSLLKQAFSQFMKNGMDPDIQLDYFLAVGIINADVNCLSTELQNIIGEAKHAE